MTRAEKSKILPQARDLYAGGYSKSRICEELKIGSTTTLSGWMAEEAAAGNDWDALRKKKLGSDPYAPVRAARKRVEWLLQHQEEFLADPGYDDRLNKALLNQDKIEARYGSAERILDVLDQLTLHAAGNVKADDFRCAQCGAPHDALAILEAILKRFTDSVKAGELEVSA